MAHYAKVLNGTVIQVIVADPTFFTKFIDTSPGTWLTTSYNTRGNVHFGANGQPDGGIPLRANYAGLGYNYDAINDVFYAPSPYPSWVLNKTTWTWNAPVPYPTGGGLYKWDEPTLSWVLVLAGI